MMRHALTALVLAAALAAPSLARADWSSGPTIPLAKIDLAAGHATSVLAAGAGYAVEYGWLPRVIAGHAYDMISVEGAAFLGHGQGVTSASVAVLACTLQGLLCGGGGRDLYVSSGSADWFALVSLGINFSLAGGSPAPASAPGFAMPASAPRGNEVVW